MQTGKARNYIVFVGGNPNGIRSQSLCTFALPVSIFTQTIHALILAIVHNID
jgi:hypothetical protein